MLLFLHFFLLLIQECGMFWRVIVLKRLPHSLLGAQLGACCINGEIGWKWFHLLDLGEDSLWRWLSWLAYEMQDILANGVYVWSWAVCHWSWCWIASHKTIVPVVHMYFSQIIAFTNSHLYDIMDMICRHTLIYCASVSVLPIFQGLLLLWLQADCDRLHVVVPYTAYWDLLSCLRGGHLN